MNALPPFFKSRRHPWVEFKKTLPFKTNNVQPILYGDLKKDAQEHEKLREELVGELLCILNIMATKKIIPPESYPIVTISKAQFQAVHSTDEKQAAHCMPGQILLNGKTPSHFLMIGQNLSDDTMMTAMRLNAIFSRTEDLHNNFNYIDSRLEDKGLRTALKYACSKSVNLGLTQQSSKINRDSILQCFDEYKNFVRSPKEGLTPFELAYQHIEQMPKNKEKDVRLTILDEEAKIAESYFPNSLSVAGMKNIESYL
jgi:hypothetical protein